MQRVFLIKKSYKGIKICITKKMKKAAELDNLH